MARHPAMIKLVKLGPTHVEGKLIPEKGRRTNFGPDYPLVFGGQLQPSPDDEYFEIFHNGEQPTHTGIKASFWQRLMGGKDSPSRIEPIIVQSGAKLILKARSVKSGDWTTLLDAGVQGYDALACDGPCDTISEELRRFSWDGATEFKAWIFFTYNNDFDAEQRDGDYEISDGKIKFEYSDGTIGEHQWDVFRRNAFDWFEMEVEGRGGAGAEIVSLELG